MAGPEIERRLAAILSADAVGYSRLMADALAKLDLLVEQGWSVSWRWEIEHNPIYDPVREHPRYRAIIERLERHVAEQRRLTT